MMAIIKYFPPFYLLSTLVPPSYASRFHNKLKTIQLLLQDNFSQLHSFFSSLTTSYNKKTFTLASATTLIEQKIGELFPYQGIQSKECTYVSPIAEPSVVSNAENLPLPQELKESFLEKKETLEEKIASYQQEFSQLETKDCYASALFIEKLLSDPFLANLAKDPSKIDSSKAAPFIAQWQEIQKQKLPIQNRFIEAKIAYRKNFIIDPSHDFISQNSWNEKLEHFEAEIHEAFFFSFLDLIEKPQSTAEYDIEKAKFLVFLHEKIQKFQEKIDTVKSMPVTLLNFLEDRLLTVFLSYLDHLENIENCYFLFDSICKLLSTEKSSPFCITPESQNKQPLDKKLKIYLFDAIYHSRFFRHNNR